MEIEFKINIDDKKAKKIAKAMGDIFTIDPRFLKDRLMKLVEIYNDINIRNSSIKINGTPIDRIVGSPFRGFENIKPTTDNTEMDKSEEAIPETNKKSTATTEQFGVNFHKIP